MGVFLESNGTLFFSYRAQNLRIDAWGEDSFRIRAALGSALKDDDAIPQALLTPSKKKADSIQIKNDLAEIVNGKLKATIDFNIPAEDNTNKHNGRIVFYNTETGKVVLEEYLFQTKLNEAARKIYPTAEGLHELFVRFKSDREEKIFGLGQHHNRILNQKGCMLELRQRNRDVTIPFMLSSNGYGFLWNNPGIGRFTSSVESTVWEAKAAYQLDYWITLGDTPQVILGNYMQATGVPGNIPEWATGFWQCKLRYKSQEELLSIAREYKQRGLPISVIVIDYFHWSAQGDWDFDPKYWPDPEGMVEELENLGIKVMVSVWPTVSTKSRNFAEMRDRGFLTRGRDGNLFLFPFAEVGIDPEQYVYFYDPTNPEARDYYWAQVKQNYFDRKIQCYWLDACEPETIHGKTEEMALYQGPGVAIANAYPFLHEMGMYENMQKAGLENPINLCRSAWAGSQRYGAAVWSGDIPSSFGSLKRQIRSGLNMSLSGIPWWTTDIGGFTGGKIDDPEFRELVVRWFQYGVFCPLFRLHGVRISSSSKILLGSGDDNEVWSFGAESYEIITKYLELREKLRPYISELFKRCALDGTPLMRPLFYDYPEDKAAWNIENEFMFGPDYLVAPVEEINAVARSVYLPEGVNWINAWTGEETEGGAEVQVAAPLAQIPLFIRKGAENPLQ